MLALSIAAIAGGLGFMPPPINAGHPPPLFAGPRGRATRSRMPGPSTRAGSKLARLARKGRVGITTIR